MMEERRFVSIPGQSGRRRSPAALSNLASEVNAGVEQALAQAEPTPPEGVNQPDWRRVLQA